MRPLVTAVTALQFISFPHRPTTTHTSDVLFAGIGNQLHVYTTDNLERAIQGLEIFEANITIHGFSNTSTKDDFITVYGGRNIVILQVEFSNINEISNLNIYKQFVFQNWIWHCKWICYNKHINEDYKLVIVTDYSNIFVCNKHLNIESHVQSSDTHELIWSSTLFISENQNHQLCLYNLAANSFGQIVVNSIASVLSIFNVDSNNKNRNTNFIGSHHLENVHKGPVMNMKVSKSLNKMVSVSVDRTIRIWKSKPSPDCKICPSQGCFIPYLTHYGHVARIWDVQFINYSRRNENNNNNNEEEEEEEVIASVGEDRSCRVWSTSESSKQLAIYRSHVGRNIWTMSTTSKTMNKKYILLSSGGEDGCIKSHKLLIPLTNNNTDNNNNINIISFKLPDNLKNPRKLNCSNDESVRTLLYLNDHFLLLTSDFGRILTLHLNQKQKQPIWTQIFKHPKGIAFTPSSLSFLTVCSNSVYKDVIICAGHTNGYVSIIPIRLNHQQHDIISIGPSISFQALLSKDGLDERMVMGVFTEDTFKNEDEGVHFPIENSLAYGDLFVACPSGDLYHWQLPPSSLFVDDNKTNDVNNDDNIDFINKQMGVKFITKYEAHRSSKTTLVTSTCMLRSSNLLVTGDKGGRLHVYKIPTDSSINVVRSHSWLKLHNDRISCLKVLSEDKKMILSSGFDGIITNINIDESNKIHVRSKQKTIEHTNTITNVFDNPNIIAGFKGNILSMWDLRRHIEIFQYDVGNWRRANCISYNPDNNNNAIDLSFWRAGKLYIVHKLMVSNNLICGGIEFHGGRANNLSIIKKHNNLYYIITGSEDTMIKLTKLNFHSNLDRTGQLNWFQRLQGHISCVNDVQFNKKLIASCGGNDEVIIWTSSHSHDDNDDIWKLSSKFNISSFIQKVNTEQNDDDDDDDETEEGREAIMRVTTIDSLKYDNDNDNDEDKMISWVIGRSDGRLFKLDCLTNDGKENESKLEMIGKHENEAILCINSSFTSSCIVSGGSGGNIYLWRLLKDDSSSAIQVQHIWNNVHSGGVNCIDIVDISDNRIVISGGDDEKIRIRFVNSRHTCWESQLNEGHSAAVTSIWTVKDEDEKRIYFVSVGADQRVNFWKIELDNNQQNGIHVECILRRYSAVADISSVECIVRECMKDNKCRKHLVAVVCGYGLEIIDGPRLT